MQDSEHEDCSETSFPVPPGCKKTTGTFDRRVKINSDFMKGADLKPVLDFLSEK